jgi:hypothetical protein
MIQTDRGRLICEVCGREWQTDDQTSQLLEDLVSHAETHPAPDEARPHIWLR